MKRHMLWCVCILSHVIYKKEFGVCGTTRWKAAKSKSKMMQHLDETGLVAAGCWHGIVQKAVNMFCGEM